MSKKIKIEIELDLPDDWAEEDVHPGEVTEHLHDLFIKNGELHNLLMEMKVLSSKGLTVEMKKALKSNYNQNRVTYASAKLMRCSWQEDPDLNLLDLARQR